MLISLKAGGVGINLTAACHAFIMVGLHKRHFSFLHVSLFRQGINWAPAPLHVFPSCCVLFLRCLKKRACHAFIMAGTSATSYLFLMLCNLRFGVAWLHGFLGERAKTLSNSHLDSLCIQDPWWNPAVEEQAIMRVHRIGQKKPVTVTRFIVEVSV